jgi:hypothetical protein
MMGDFLFGLILGVIVTLAGIFVWAIWPTRN